MNEIQVCMEKEFFEKGNKTREKERKSSWMMEEEASALTQPQLKMSQVGFT